MSRWPLIRRSIQLASLGTFLYLFLYVAWPYAAVSSGKVLADTGRAPVEFFLWLDPLTGLSSAVAARHWNIAIFGLLAIGVISIIIPRGFCGYLCPLGTLIDASDWILGKIFHRPRLKRRGWWAALRWHLLIATLAAAAMGVMLAGYVAAIPVLTRGLMFTLGRAQVGILRNWGLAGPATVALYLSIILFAIIFLLGLLTPRFWCRYVCPSGALFSLISLLRINQRRVNDACKGCGRCARACPFDAVRKDHQAAPTDCSFCQTCATVCPTQAITFNSRPTAPMSAENPTATSCVSTRAPTMSAPSSRFSRTPVTKAPLVCNATASKAMSARIWKNPWKLGKKSPPNSFHDFSPITSTADSPFLQQHCPARCLRSWRSARFRSR